MHTWLRAVNKCLLLLHPHCGHSLHLALEYTRGIRIPVGLQTPTAYLLKAWWYVTHGGVFVCVYVFLCVQPQRILRLAEALPPSAAELSLLPFAGN